MPPIFKILVGEKRRQGRSRVRDKAFNGRRLPHLRIELIDASFVERWLDRLPETPGAPKSAGAWIAGSFAQ